MPDQEEKWRYGKDRFGGLISIPEVTIHGSFQEQRSGTKGNEDRGGNKRKEEGPEFGGLEMRRLCTKCL